MNPITIRPTEQELLDCVYEGDPDCTGPYYMGIDWGGVNALTVCVVMEVDTKRVVKCAYWKAARIEYIVDVAISAMQTWPSERIIAANNGLGGALSEMLETMTDHTIRPYTITPSTKASLLGALNEAIREKQIKLYADPAIIREWEQFETAHALALRAVDMVARQRVEPYGLIG